MSHPTKRPIGYKLTDRNLVVPVYDMNELAEYLGNSAGRRVAETTVGHYWISTMFLALDHNFMDRGNPICFETMVFDNRDRSRRSVDRFVDLNGHMERYVHHYEAVDGHNKMVAMVRMMFYRAERELANNRHSKHRMAALRKRRNVTA